MDDDALQAELEQLTANARAVFALGCAARVGIIYETLAEPYYDEINLARKLGWEFASGKRSVENEAQLLQETIEGLPKTFPDTELDPGQTPVLSVGISTLSALESLTDKTSESAFSAAMSVLDAIEQSEQEDGIEEEQGWQEKALDVVKNLKTENAEDSVFQNVFPENPEWKKQFLEDFE